jgi:hypothetical protein
MFAGTFVHSRSFSYRLIFSCIRLDKAEVVGSSPTSPISRFARVCYAGDLRLRGRDRREPRGKGPASRPGDRDHVRAGCKLVPVFRSSFPRRQQRRNRLLCVEDCCRRSVRERRLACLWRGVQAERPLVVSMDRGQMDRRG